MQGLTPRFAGVLTALLACTAARAQVQAPTHIDVAFEIDSGVVSNGGRDRAVIWSEVVHLENASWLRLLFDQASLGAAPAGGEPTILRMTSLLDGAVQTMNQEHLRQWQFTSAYFNGDMLLVEVIADPGAGTSRIVVAHGFAGPLVEGQMESICGPDDDRILSSDPRAARVVPVGCTAWLFNDANRCFLTAGHCTGTSFQTVEFNVPLSGGGGAIQHPGPEDQYAVDPASMQSNGGGGTGNDWAYFGCFPNTQTGLTPFEAQGDSYTLDTPPAVGGQSIRITGYGTTSSPVPPEWNQVQKTHVGPFVTFSGTLVQYATDTTGGNSGSPVILEDTGAAIGIHTHGGCNASGGNSGTGSNHAGLIDALANPQGVCVPMGPIAFEYPDGQPELLATGGPAFRVELIGQNGGDPEPGTGLLHYDAGTGFQTVALVEVTPNVYDAVFPELPCGTAIDWYVSAEATDGSAHNDPFNAPDTAYAGTIGDALDFIFGDDFETDMGWTVVNDPTLTTGQWERGTPAGGGDRGDPPTDADGSGQCYVTGLADGDNDIDGGGTTLISPILDSTEGDAHIAYWRWFSNNFGGSPNQDVMVVEISNDGGLNWVELETIGPNDGQSGGGWFFVSYRVADFVAVTDQVRVRFTASDLGAGSVVEAGVDGVRMNRSASGVTCDEADCPADLDGSGSVDVSDLLAVIGAWGGCPPACDADINDDGTVDVDDLIDLLAAWGPCP